MGLPGFETPVNRSAGTHYQQPRWRGVHGLALARQDDSVSGQQQHLLLRESRGCTKPRPRGGLVASTSCPMSKGARDQERPTVFGAYALPAFRHPLCFTATGSFIRSIPDRPVPSCVMLAISVRKF